MRDPLRDPLRDPFIYKNLKKLNIYTKKALINAKNFLKQKKILIHI